MKKILVTGGAGFIGSHLCEKLLESGHYVICLDNFFSGREKNIRHLRNNRYFRVIEQDVTEKIHISCDEIYNLACPASPVFYQKDGIKTIKTIVLGAINTLELAIKTGAKILQASTSEIYGDPQIHPQHEGYRGYVNMLGARSCYNEAKRCAETIFMNYHRQEKVNIKIVRIFNTYGPKMRADDGRVISNFIVQALKGNEITIFGDGSQTRSFQYFDDLIRGLLLTMESPESFTGPVNIGNPAEIKIIDLAQIIIKMTGSKSKIKFCPLPEDDPRQRQPDISLAKAVLNWSPEVTLQEGLKMTIDYFKKEIVH
ncbi:MAG TPA: SDR family oxidoreductase [Bacteroidales bacterium]|nr:SDR family oxidoreductase [Bacteroidales bacterium]HQJ20564.1 SDR family oxidoreductase [Bacteroidales bacterium]